MREPDISLARTDLNLPEHAKFIGYIFYNPWKDDFLYRCKGIDGGRYSQWTRYPFNAMRFTDYKKAHKRFNHLELESKCVIALLFDCDGNYFVVHDRNDEFQNTQFVP